MGKIKLRLRGCPSRLRLSDIGSCSLTRSVAGSLGSREFIQEIKVLFAQAHHTACQDHVHVGFGRLEQDILFGVACVFLRSPQSRLVDRDVFVVCSPSKRV
ncbi:MULTISPECIES: hypothetical protein [unclassified Ensifer]|uniref:hypothetical protein n=1 Tax=unclassified Ensifer TaxID=2633371 RepID=UPI0008130964|nr:MULTISPECIES: hypothetical protein [unclassified Ensifer]